MLVLFFQPNNRLVKEWILRLAMGGIPWLILYLLTIFILAWAFAFINVNSDQIAERMQRSGEYIENLYPGEATRRYIHKIVIIHLMQK